MQILNNHIALHKLAVKNETNVKNGLLILINFIISINAKPC